MGIVLVGGGSLLSNFDALLREQTQLPVTRGADPSTAVIRGAGRALEDGELLRKVALLRLDGMPQMSITARQRASNRYARSPFNQEAPDVWVANYYFSPENGRLTSLAPDGGVINNSPCTG